MTSSLPDRQTALFFRLAARPIPRVIRMINVAREAGVASTFVGAFREQGLQSNDWWDEVPIVRIGRQFPLLNGRRPIVYLSGVLSYWKAAVREIKERRPSFIHASDFEAGVPAVIAGRVLGIPVIYNIHDNLSVRYSVPRWFAAALNALEGVVAMSAQVTLVPEAFRRDLLPVWAQGNVRVVRNSPQDPGFTPPPATPESRPRVLFAGWLDYGRGLDEVIELASRATIQLIVAGEGDDAIVNRLRSTPNVEYLGFCNHARIIAETAKCDYVAAFYDPRRTINRYAASNKIAEALAVGRPVLINSELVVAGDLVRAGVALPVTYGSIRTMGDAILEHFRDRGKYVRSCVDARAYYQSAYDFSNVRAATLEALAMVGIQRWH